VNAFSVICDHLTTNNDVLRINLFSFTVPVCDTRSIPIIITYSKSESHVIHSNGSCAGRLTRFSAFAARISALDIFGPDYTSKSRSKCSPATERTCGSLTRTIPTPPNGRNREKTSSYVLHREECTDNCTKRRGSDSYLGHKRIHTQHVRRW